MTKTAKKVIALLETGPMAFDMINYDTCVMAVASEVMGGDKGSFLMEEQLAKALGISREDAYDLCYGCLELTMEDKGSKGAKKAAKVLRRLIESKKVAA